MSGPLQSMRGRRGEVLSWALVSSMIALVAWSHRFLQDDAFISVRYADRLAHGLGLTWNDGERIEGFTNLLWTLLLAGMLRLGAAPVAATYALGMASLAGTLAAAWALARELGASRAGAALGLAILGTNASYLAYVTGGLETQLQAAFACAMAWLAVRAATAPAPRAAGPAFGAVASLALWNRLDAAPLVTIFTAFLVFEAARAGRLRRVAVALAPLALGGLLLVAFKLAYFGEILPNTFHAKVGGDDLAKRGRAFTELFIDQYALAPALAIGAAGVALAARRRTVAPLALALA